MHTVATGRTRPVIDRRNNKAVRDIARLRARRAARLAAEIAAGRRRMVMTGICALSMVILTIVIAATSITWTWILVPIAALVASLSTSRVAAVRSQRASEREFEQLTKLRADVRGGRPVSSAPKVRKAEATKASDEAVVAPRVSSSSAASAPSASAPRTDGAEPATQTGSVPSLVFNVEVLPEAVEVADTPARAWTVAPIPAPTYASRDRIRGRIVHADTDLRGIPRITAAIPARPIAQTAQVGARSTEEVVADQIVALDLDAVLDARRAQ